MNRTGVSTDEILRLLRETEMSIGGIAETVGCHQSNITVRVKHALGITPSEYRLQHGWVSTGPAGQRALSPPQVESLVAQYAAGEPVISIARKRKMAAGTVAGILRASGVEIRPVWDYRERLHLPDEEIAQRYEDGETTTDLAGAYYCSERKIRAVLDSQGIARRGPTSRAGRLARSG